MTDGRESSQQMRGRWARELTDREMKAVLNGKRFDTALWEFAGMEFFASQRHLAIIRTSGAGGDTYNVHGGWKYANLILFLQDWTEIKALATSTSRWSKS